jgi:hypothetical protein
MNPNQHKAVHAQIQRIIEDCGWLESEHGHFELAHIETSRKNDLVVVQVYLRHIETRWADEFAVDSSGRIYSFCTGDKE